MNISVNIGRDKIFNEAKKYIDRNTTSMKTIYNNCRIGDKCILEIDGKYFGYDNHIPYPETLYSNSKKAFVFKNQSDALSTTSWHNGTTFRLVPVR